MRERDKARDWNLLAHPARMRVHTIDALCLTLMRQAPLAVKLGALPQLTERALPMYVEAARAELEPRRRPTTTRGSACSTTSTTMPIDWWR